MVRRDHSSKIFTFSNLLTISRIMLTPFIVASLFAQDWHRALLFFCFAGLSDLLDGFVARLLKEPTWLGSVLDPIADKFLAVSFLSAFFLNNPTNLLPAGFIWVVVVRELLLLAGGCLLFLSNSSLQFNPTWLGKLATFLLFILMIVILTSLALDVSLTIFINWLIFVTLMCSIISFVQYAFTGLRHFFKS